ncbi:MAG: hypothetical protein KIT31_05755 [Deltaproteobacteria bacterium]|nr:hypothetical protein [Deltaproteobacteria bacterium]
MRPPLADVRSVRPPLADVRPPLADVRSVRPPLATVAGSRLRVLGAATLVAVLGAGCDLITDSFATNDFSGDPFPIEVELTSGAVVVGVRTGTPPVDRVAVLDILSPLSVIDPGPAGSTGVGGADLTLLGMRATGTLDVPRAAFLDTQVLSLHPCQAPSCAVGSEAAPRGYQAIIGANALAGDAVRLRLGDARVFVFADIGGGDRDRTYACDSVFPSPYRGGGTLVIAGTELSFSGRRVTLQTCAGFDAGPGVVQGRRGADLLLVASTGVAPTVIGLSAYRRYRNAVPSAPAIEGQPDATVFLPSGPITGKSVTIPRLALVATSSSSPRAPCRQVYAHRLLTARDCDGEEDCPCENGDQFCAIPAVLELQPPAGIDVLVIDDANPTLQALRTELRPDQPEVDGILGTQAIRDAELDIDYPHDRVLGRCAAPPTGATTDPCSARPALAERADRPQIQGCVPNARNFPP